MSVDWKKGVVCPIYEKIGQNKCDSYRGVTKLYIHSTVKYKK